MGVLRKPQHQRIFSLFLNRQKLSHADIAKQTALRPNLLSYYLRQLISQGVLEKRDDSYAISKQSEHLIPRFKQLTGEETLKLPVVVFAIEHQNKILLLQRKNRPYAGYWGLPGGKIRQHETIAEAARRIALRETGISLAEIQTCTVIDERVTDNGSVKHGWFIFVVKSKAALLPKELPDNCDWFDVKELNGQVIPSDKWMIRDALKQTSHVHEFSIEESDGRITEFRGA
ncbi:MAG TPA: NUDIX domain-containing protein [Candidatus Binatia bacterium]|nr:NUDIX domain-containing protein [Candidatus Binatia bacterium]